MEVTGLDRSRPVSKAYRPSTALRPLAGPRALAKCQISVSPGVRQRHWSIQCQTSLFLDFPAGLILTAKGVTYTFHDTEDEMYLPIHLQRHPFGRVPALQHDDFMLYETSAIAAYVDDVLPGPKLTPADPRKRALPRHLLGLRAEGQTFTITFGGRQLFTATDRTIAGAGKIALWTKADSVTRFDAIAIKALP